MSRGCANRKPVSSLHVAHGRHVNCDDEGKACAFTMKDRRDCQKMTSVFIASTTCSFSYIFRLIFKIKCLTLYTQNISHAKNTSIQSRSSFHIPPLTNLKSSDNQGVPDFNRGKKGQIWTCGVFLYWRWGRAARCLVGVPCTIGYNWLGSNASRGRDWTKTASLDIDSTDQNSCGAEAACHCYSQHQLLH